MIAIALAVSACTLPADDAGEISVNDELDGLLLISEPGTYLDDSQSDPGECFEEACDPELSYAQCVAACRAGVKAIERFCALIPHPIIKASCYAMRLKGPVACTNWCYWYFVPH